MSAMTFYLTDTEKLLILGLAASLFLISVILTVCVVSPFCACHRWLFKDKKGAKAMPMKGSPAEQLLKAESKHFQLTVIPHYGTPTAIAPGQPVALGNGAKPKSTSTKSRLGRKKSSVVGELPPAISNAVSNPGQIKITFGVERVDESSVKLQVTLHEAGNLVARGYGVEPACYVALDLVMLAGSKVSRRKSLNNRIAATFKTATSRRGLAPMFDETFTSQVLPKSILKDGLLRLKVMDDERFANDVCLGETNLAIKELVASEANHEGMVTTFQLSPPKEYKGELLVGYCYLPTSRRVTLTVFKGNLSSTLVPNRNYYVRILMFVNGKLTKKKKTPTSEKLLWSDCETLTFESALTHSGSTGQGHAEKVETIAFMLVLSWSSDASSNPVATSSPSSPESPDTPENGAGSRKDRHIGHFVLGQECWREMTNEPRKQFSKWVKLL